MHKYLAMLTATDTMFFKYMVVKNVLSPYIAGASMPIRVFASATWTGKG
jgi:hypothetical protein